MEEDSPALSQFRRQWHTELALSRESQEHVTTNHGLPDTGAFFDDRETTLPSVISETTATLRGDSAVRESSSDVPMHDVEEEMVDKKRIIMAIDFGTTFSSISFLVVPIHVTDNEEITHESVNELQHITNYAADPSGSYQPKRKEVPTEIWYPKKAYLDPDTFQGRRELTDIDIMDDPNEDPMLYYNQDNDDDADMQADDEDDEDSRETFWGYEVQKQLTFPDTNRNQNRRMSRFKLLLDTSEYTDVVRQDLEPNLDELKRKKIIKHREDVIGDYLRHLFSHAAKETVIKQAISHAWPIEFVLCVPPIWTPRASRIMQDKMERAMRESRFARIEDNNSVDNLFIVSEPEAAAAYVLAKTGAVVKNETFVLLDAGGGTVDAITYTVQDTSPLRLQSEVSKPGGDLCGSSFLNEAFQKHLHRRLQGEDYLEVNGLTIEGIIDQQVIIFENDWKRKVDITTPNPQEQLVYIQGLRANPLLSKRFRANRLRIQRADLLEIFLPLLQRVATVMRTQLVSAMQKGRNVKKVILIGGFANSPSLRSHLERELAATRSLKRDVIRLITPPAAESDISVSSGAVLRALNKRNGPVRISRSSYGFLCSETFDPENIPQHTDIRPYHDPLDGMKYIMYTINWLIQKDDEVPTEKEYSIQVYYTFDAKRDTRFECKEYLYVSDNRMESHYRRYHDKNRSAQIIGVIETDMTFLKEQNLIEPTEPEPGTRGKRHYKVEYELVMIVNGRNMRWEARYGREGTVQGAGQVSIAAAFVPGTQ